VVGLFSESALDFAEIELFEAKLCSASEKLGVVTEAECDFECELELSGANANERELRGGIIFAS
jgi:hypothetical protein